MSEGSETRGASEALGQRLKEERERRGFSQAKAADELHLDGWIVDALESGDFARVGPQVYVKGHIKRYAGLLGMPAAEIIGAYEATQATSAATVSTAVAPSSAGIATLGPAATGLAQAGAASAAGKRRTLPTAAILSAAIAVLAAVALAWWKPWESRAQPVNTAAVSVPPAAVLTDGGGPELPADASALSSPASAVDEDQNPNESPWEADPTPPSTPPPASVALSPPIKAPVTTHPSASKAVTSPSSPTAAKAQPPVTVSHRADAAGAGVARLRLSFSADSWVDVRDAAGLRLFAGDGRANSVRVITGAAPLRVYLRSANGVQLEINNRATAIGAQYFSGNQAHFEAGADGVLRRDTHAAAAARPRG